MKQIEKNNLYQINLNKKDLIKWSVYLKKYFVEIKKINITAKIKQIILKLTSQMKMNKLVKII